MTRPPCYRDYDAAEAGRHWGSFAWLVQHLDDGHPVDQFVTDSEPERDRLIEAGLDQGYQVAAWHQVWIGPVMAGPGTRHTPEARR